MPTLLFQKPCFLVLGVGVPKKAMTPACRPPPNPQWPRGNHPKPESNPASNAVFNALSGPAGRGRQRSFQHTFRGGPPSSGNTPKGFLKAAQNAHFPSAGKSHMRVRIPTSKRRHKRVSSGGTSWLWLLLLSGPTLNRWRGQLWKVGPTCWPQVYTRPRRESPPSGPHVISQAARSCRAVV